MVLFQQKYGDKADWEFIEYLKINAIMKENLDKANPELFKNAMARLQSLVEKSDNYEMKKGVWKFLITHYLKGNQFLKTLQLAKDYYAGTRSSFDFEESPFPAEVMLYSYARLGIVKDLEELATDKNIRKIVSPSIVYSYLSFAKLKNQDVDGLIQIYEKSKKQTMGELASSFLYNTAEAYFRKGDYKNAYVLYQKYIKEFPYELTLSHALLRLAICSDLLDKSPIETMALYKDAVDRSLSSEVSFEARVRYVAFRSIRKKLIDDRDREIRIFLDQDPTLKLTENNKNLSKILYQVRLRTLIVDRKFKEALQYFSLIPLSSMSKIDVRSFEGDAAEIVYGLIEDHYKKSEYTQLVKLWQTYKNIYINKVALDPYLNFLVGSAYVRLGAYNGFDEIYKNFTQLKKTYHRTFPVWIDRPGTVNPEELLLELALIKDFKLKNYDLALRSVAELEKMGKKSTSLNVFKGLIAYSKKDFKLTISELEAYLSYDGPRTVYDPREGAEILNAYTDSIMQLGDKEKYLKVADAVLSDTKNFGTNNAYMQSVRERVAYQQLEYLGEKEKDNLVFLEEKFRKFLTDNKGSAYRGRVNYMLGSNLLKQNKTKEGKEILTQLLNDNKNSDYLREMARSELSIINIKEKTI